MKKRSMIFSKEAVTRTNVGRVEDNVGQRLGIGVAVSIGVNAMLLLIQPAGADPHVRTPWTPAPGPVTLVKNPLQVKPARHAEPDQTVVRQPQIKETEEFVRPHHRLPETIRTATPKHGPSVDTPRNPAVVVTPNRMVVPEKNQPQPRSEPENAVGSPVSPGQPEPANLTLKQSGNALSMAAPSAAEAHSVAEQARGRQATAAAAVGGVTAMTAAGAESPATAAVRTGVLRPTGAPGAPRTYIAVVSLNVRPASGDFSVPTIAGTGTPRPGVSSASAARTSAASGVIGTVSALNAAGGAVEGMVAPTRTVSLSGTGRLHLAGPSAETGTGLQRRTGAASVDVTAGAGTGIAASGRSAGLVQANSGNGVAGTVGNGVEAQNALHGGAVGEVGNGTGSRNVAGSKGHGITEGVADGGGASAGLAGGNGELNTRLGTRDGVVTIGKIGGNVTEAGSVGISGKGPVAVSSGNRGNTPLGNGPIAGGGPAIIEDPLEDGPIDDTSVIVQKGPHPISKPHFELTDALRKRKVKGVVQARATIKADGTCTVVLVKSSGDSELDEAVLSHIRSWKWEPARQDGTPIESRRLVRFTVN